MVFRGLLSMTACAMLLGSSPATRPAQNPPVADPVFLTVAPGESVLITFSGSDPDGDLFGFFPTSGFSDPSAGTLLVSCVCVGTYAGTICDCTTLFVAAPDFAGSVTFTYRAVDAEGNESADATVTIASTAQARTPEQILADIRFIVDRALLPGGEIDPTLDTALNSKLDAAEASLAAGNLEAAKGQVGAFCNQVLNSPDDKVGPDAKEALGERCDEFETAIQLHSVPCKHEPGINVTPFDLLFVDALPPVPLGDRDFFRVAHEDTRLWSFGGRDGTTKAFGTFLDRPPSSLFGAVHFIPAVHNIVLRFDDSAPGPIPCCHAASSDAIAVLDLYHHLGVQLDDVGIVSFGGSEGPAKAGFVLEYSDCDRIIISASLIWVVSGSVTQSVTGNNIASRPRRNLTGDLVLATNLGEATIIESVTEAQRQVGRHGNTGLVARWYDVLTAFGDDDPTIAEFVSFSDWIAKISAADLNTGVLAGGTSEQGGSFAHGAMTWAPRRLQLTDKTEKIRIDNELGVFRIIE